MIDGSEKRNGWLNFKLQSLHVIERRSNTGGAFIELSHLKSTLESCLHFNSHLNLRTEVFSHHLSA